MTQLEIVTLCAVILAVAGLVLFAVSVKPSVVVGPPWAAILVIIVLAGGGAVTWFLAQAAPPGSGWLPTVAVTALAVLTSFGGGPLAAASLRLTDPRPGVPASRHPSPDPPPDDPAPDDPAPDPDQRASPATPDVLRGGELVGFFERACILALLLVGYPEGIALILAIKGLGRFGELKAPAAPERFIVGTLASVLWAILGFAAITAVLS